MNSFWDHEVPYIAVLGPDHLLYIAGMLVLLVAILALRRQVRAHARAVRRALLAITVVQLVTLYSWYLLETGFDLAESLPLHSSRVSTLLALAFFVTGRLQILDVLFYFGLYAYGSFGYPQQIYPADHIMGWSFFINHAVTILVPIIAAIAYDWRPTRRALWRAFGWFCLYFLVVEVVNAAVDGNYFYLRDRPFLEDWPRWLYDPAAVVATLAVFWIGYGGARLIARFAPGIPPAVRGPVTDPGVGRGPRRAAAVPRAL